MISILLSVTNQVILMETVRYHVNQSRGKKSRLCVEEYTRYKFVVLQ